MEIPTQTSDLQQQINSWKSEVDTVRQELPEMRRRLEQMAHQQTNPEMLIHVERFQNQFICQKEVADELFHDLKQSAKKLMNNGVLAIVHDDRPVDDVETLHDRMETFKKLYGELKNEFEQFVK
jgi:predicted RNase H-like nuclease (RuvC/YqgF family)